MQAIWFCVLFGSTSTCPNLELQSHNTYSEWEDTGWTKASHFPLYFVFSAYPLKTRFFLVFLFAFAKLFLV